MYLGTYMAVIACFMLPLPSQSISLRQLFRHWKRWLARAIMDVWWQRTLYVPADDHGGLEAWNIGTVSKRASRLVSSRR